MAFDGLNTTLADGLVAINAHRSLRDNELTSGGGADEEDQPEIRGKSPRAAGQGGLTVDGDRKMIGGEIAAIRWSAEETT